MQITHTFLKEHGLLPHKKIAQHLLIDESDVDTIIKALDVHPDDNILEIGAGCGILTERILNEINQSETATGSLISVEIDDRYVNYLKKRFANNKHFKIIKQNILNIKIPELFKNHLKVVGNIPYYISSPILRLLFNNHTLITDIVIMLQKEVGMRVVAEPSDEYFGLLSIIRMLHYDASIAKYVDRTHFIPQPKVDSIVLKLNVHKPIISYSDEQILIRILKYAFGARRKMIKNTLKPLGSPEDILQWCASADIDVNDRAENIDLNKWIRFLNVYKNDKKIL